MRLGAIWRLGSDMRLIQSSFRIIFHIYPARVYLTYLQTNTATFGQKWHDSGESLEPITDISSWQVHPELVAGKILPKGAMRLGPRR